MKRCGSVCARSCGSHQHRPKTSDSQPHCPWSECNTSSTSCVLVSGADCLPMVHHRHPMVAATLVAQLSGNPETRYLSAVREANMSWQLQGSNHRRGRPVLVARPARREAEDHEAGTVRRGRQHEAASSGGRTGQRSHVQQSIRPGEGHHQVTRRSRAGAPFTATQTCRETTIPSHLFPSQRAHLRVPVFKNTTKIQREDLPERESLSL